MLASRTALISLIIVGATTDTSGLFTSSPSSVIVPDILLPGQPLSYLHVHQEPTQLHPSREHIPVTCYVTNTSQNGGLQSTDAQLFFVNNTDMAIYSMFTLEEILPMTTTDDLASYYLDIECEAETTDTPTSLTVNITVAKVARWRATFCDLDRGKERLCFGGTHGHMNVYENIGNVRLGELSSIHPSFCEGHSLDKVYRLTSKSNAVALRGGSLWLDEPLDYEETHEVHVNVTCSLTSQTQSVTLSRTLNIRVLDLHDCGPFVEVRKQRNKVAYLELEPGQRRSSFFEDCDQDVPLSAFTVTVSDDPGHILKVSNLEIKFGRKKIGFSVDTIPDYDANVRVLIRDETVVSTDPLEGLITYNVFIRGRTWTEPASETDQLTETGVPEYSEDNVHYHEDNISVNAAMYAIAVELFKIIPGHYSYFLARDSPPGPFNISKDLLYVSGDLTEYEHTVVYVAIDAHMKIDEFDEFDKSNEYVHKKRHYITMNITGSVELRDCGRTKGCSMAETREECEAMCGFGARSGRCTWAGPTVGRMYTTCVGDSTRCTDQTCDDTLEQLEGMLCPQDCTNGQQGINPSETGIWFCTDPDSCNQTLATPRPPTSVEMSPDNNGLTCGQQCRLKITLGLLGTCVLVASVVLGVCFCRGQSNKARMKHVASIVSLSAVPSDYVDDNERLSGILACQDWPQQLLDARLKPDEQWEFPRRNLRLDHVLGEGEFGRVVKARALDIQDSKGFVTVAVKMLKECASSAELRDLLSEFTLLRDVSHKNVIQLLGVCSQKGPFYLIVEYCEHGCLRSYLRQSRQATYITTDISERTSGSKSSDNISSVDVKDLMSFAWQTAKGMQYLTEMKLVHRDLAARNILIAAGKIVKISDFGLTRDVYEGDAYLKKTKGRLPVKWMAPESLYDQLYTSKSDVWSFGVVLWEIVTLGANPYPGVPPERLYLLLKSGYRMDRPQGCSDDLFRLMHQCWRQDPAHRHSFKHLAGELDKMLQASTSYLDLTYQMDNPFGEEDDPDVVSEDTNHDTSKASISPNEPEYGSINILSTDVNSYVVTPTLQGNGELVFNNWKKNDSPSDRSDRSPGGRSNQSLDGAVEETQFIQTPPDVQSQMECDSLLSENMA